MKRLPDENRSKPVSVLVKKARAANIIADLAMNMSLRAVAEKYEMNPATVKNILRWAEQQEFFTKAEDAIRERLIPLAIDAYEKALKKAIANGEFEAAERLLRGMRLLSTSASPAHPFTGGAIEDGDKVVEWEAFIAARGTKIISAAEEETPLPASTPGVERNNPASVIEAEVVRENGSEKQSSQSAGGGTDDKGVA